MTYTLDAREMEHPEPFERSISILRQMECEDTYIMVHKKEPFPLYELAKTLGFDYKTTEENGIYTMVFCKENNR